MTQTKRLLFRLFLASVVVAMVPSATHAQAPSLTAGPDPAVIQEIEYAKHLLEIGLPDFSDAVRKRIEATSPEVRNLIKVLDLRTMLARGKFDEVKALIAKELDQDSSATWAMKLALADGYFSWGRYNEAEAIYQGFFKRNPQGPPESLNSFYMESAYKFAQMLLLMRKDAAAVEAYQYVLKAKIERHVQRQVLGEIAELLVKLAQNNPAQRATYAKQITEILNKLMWEQDVWFGKAIVIMAHMKVMDGKVEDAMKLIDEYRAQLEEIDRALKEESEKTGEELTKLSPMAQCRYLIASILHDEAEKLLAQGATANREKIISLLAGPRDATGKRTSGGALQHFTDVFVDYPSTPWAADAGKRAARVEEILKSFGAKITTKITTDQWSKVVSIQLQEARSQMAQGQQEKAIDTYFGVVNLFPETESSIEALGEIVRCYVELNNADTEIYSTMVSRYLAERFCRNDTLAMKAGDQVVRIAELYGERKQDARREALYGLFFECFPKHSLAPGMQFRFGELRFKDEKYEAAVTYYRKVLDDYPDLSLALDAQNRIAVCYGKMNDATNEIAALEKYIEMLDKRGKGGVLTLDSKYRLAYAKRRIGGESLPQALAQFEEIIKFLSAAPDPFQNAAADDRARANEILEGCIYFRANMLVAMKEPADKVQEYRQSAVAALEDLIKRFPKSRYAPAALSQIATLFTLQEKSEEAANILRRLEKEYPDAPETKNSKYTLGMNLLSLGLKQQATKVFKEMFEGVDGKYSDNQILTAATELSKAGENDIALIAYDRVIKVAKERGLREPALLGKGRTLIDTKKHEEGIKAIEAMLAEFPNSGYTIDASLYLSKAYGELGAAQPEREKRIIVFNKGVEALNRANKFEKTPGGRARMTFELAQFMNRRARAEEQYGDKVKALEYKNNAIASYQTLILLSDYTNPDVSKWIIEADGSCIPLLLATDRAKDALENAEQHISRFPTSRFLNEVRRWRGDARLKLSIEAPGAGTPVPEDVPSPTGKREDVSMPVVPVEDATKTNMPAMPVEAVAATNGLPADSGSAGAAEK